jgi:hypothetical protein
MTPFHLYGTNFLSYEVNNKHSKHSSFFFKFSVLSLSDLENQNGVENFKIAHQDFGFSVTHFEGLSKCFT